MSPVTAEQAALDSSRTELPQAFPSDVGEPGVETLLPALSSRSVFMPPTGIPCGSLETLRIVE